MVSLIEQMTKEWLEELDEETKEYILENEIDHDLDYGFDAGGIYRKPFDIQSIERLAEKYSLDAEELRSDLYLIRLESATVELRNKKKLTSKQIERYFSTLRNQAHTLSEKLYEIPLELKKILDLIKEAPSIYNLASTLEDLVNAIDALDHAPINKEPLPLLKVGDDAIIKIANLWKKRTGREATYTTDPYNENKRVGDFIEFLTTSAELIGLDPVSLPERFVRLKKQIDGL